MALLGVAEMSDLSPQNAPKRTLQFTRASAMPQRSDGMRQALGKDVMRLFALALTLSLADFAVASAQTPTPESENGRYSFNPVADGVLRLDTRTGQVSQCSRSDIGWGLQGGAGRALGAGDRDRSPAGREREPEEGAFGPW